MTKMDYGLSAGEAESESRADLLKVNFFAQANFLLKFLLVKYIRLEVWEIAVRVKKHLDDYRQQTRAKKKNLL